PWLTAGGCAASKRSSAGGASLGIGLGALVGAGVDTGVRIHRALRAVVDAVEDELGVRACARSSPRDRRLHDGPMLALRVTRSSSSCSNGSRIISAAPVPAASRASFEG